MIHYNLVCDKAHEFEGWFRNSEDFDAQNSRSLISCPFCGSNNVQKKLMAPAVSTARSKAARVDSARVEETVSEPSGGAPSADGAAGEVQQAALVPLNAQQQEMIEALRKVRKKIIDSSDYVGEQFSEEARRMHYGETEQRNIHGESNAEEVKSLLEEGIDILPLPVLPDEKN